MAVAAELSFYRLDRNISELSIRLYCALLRFSTLKLLGGGNSNVFVTIIKNNPFWGFYWFYPYFWKHPSRWWPTQRFLGEFSPRKWGEMIQFDLRIFFKWVGGKPPTRLLFDWLPKTEHLTPKKRVPPKMWTENKNLEAFRQATSTTCLFRCFAAPTKTGSGKNLKGKGYL